MGGGMVDGWAGAPAGLFRALLDVDRRLAAVGSMPELLQEAMQRLTEVSGIDGAVGWMPAAAEPDTLEVAYHAGVGADVARACARIPLSDPAWAACAVVRAWRERRIELIADIRAFPGVTPGQRAAAASGLRAVAALPLVSAENIQGVLSLYSRRAGFFGADTVPEWIGDLRAILAQGQEGVTRRKGEGRLERVHALYEALLAEGELSLTARDEDGLLREACRGLVASGLFGAAWIARPVFLAGELQRLRCLAVSGVGNTALLDLHLDMPQMGRDTPCAGQRAWRAGAVEADENWLQGFHKSSLHRLYRQADWHSLVAFPIMRGGKPWALCELVAGRATELDSSVTRFLARVGGLIGHALDEMDLKLRLEEARRDALHLAHHDVLTGLPNRLALESHLQRALARTDRGEDLLAVGLLDLDDFKLVNDNFGHSAGDGLLRTVAARLTGVIRETDYIARLGGDEFAIVLERIESWDALESTLRRIREAIEAPVRLGDGGETSVRASLGYTVYPLDEGEGETLLRHADLALYQVKADKLRRAVWHRHYEAAWDERLTERIRWQSGVPGLLERGLEVHYQPVLEMASGRIIKLEALARIRDGDRVLLPTEFFPGLLSSDLRRMSLEVCDRALAQARAWVAQGVDVQVAVNFLPEHVMDATLRQELEALLARHDVAPDRLMLEVLEHGDFLSLEVARERLLALKALGVSLALDDLGSAYASLLRLKELPFDEVKLDQAFVRSIGRRPRDLRFVDSILSLARALEVSFVVEGVEDADVLDALRILDVPAVQGFAVSAPLPPEELGALLAGQQIALPPVELQPGRYMAVYAAMMRWVDVTIGTLELSPERLNSEALVPEEHGPISIALADDEHLRALHLEQHRLVSELSRCRERENLLPGIRRLRKLGQEMLASIERRMAGSEPGDQRM